MSTFEKTQSSMLELRTNRSMESGRHISSTPQIGSNGVRLSEVPFDPTKHQVSDIKLLSLFSEVTGNLYVQEVMPRKSMPVQIVEDLTSGAGDDSRINRLKANLSISLTEAVVDSKADMRDRVKHHLITNPDNKYLQTLNYNFDVIDFEEGPQFLCESIANICMKGLTFIISDFKGFNLGTQPKNKFGKTVAVKVNHQAEIYVPPSKVVLSTPSGQVRAWKPKELDLHNDSLREQNAVIVSNLESVGIKVAQVILEPSRFLRFNVEQTDTDIAEAVTRVKDAQH